MRMLVVLALLGGCHKLFDLEHVSGFDPADGDARDDGMKLDAPVDAFTCPIEPAFYDEDSDGVDDRCDACPTVSSKEAPDMDTDGLPDPCDGNWAPGGDEIKLAAMFSQPEDLESFMTSNATLNPLDAGLLEMQQNGLLHTNATFTPTAVELRLFAGVEYQFSGAEIDLWIGATYCRVIAISCNQATLGQTCVAFGPVAAANGNLGEDAMSIRQVVFRNTSGSLLCAIAGTGVADATKSALAETGSVQVVTGATLLRVQSLVIYGPK